MLWRDRGSRYAAQLIVARKAISGRRIALRQRTNRTQSATSSQLDNEKWILLALLIPFHRRRTSTTSARTVAAWYEFTTDFASDVWCKRDWLNRTAPRARISTVSSQRSNKCADRSSAIVTSLVFRALNLRIVTALLIPSSCKIIGTFTPQFP